MKRRVAEVAEPVALAAAVDRLRLLRSLPADQFDAESSEFWLSVRAAGLTPVAVIEALRLADQREVWRVRRQRILARVLSDLQ